MYHCRLCNSPKVEPAFEFGQQPIVHHLLDKADAVFATFDFKVVLCSTCGFLQMSNHPSPEILYQNYFTVSSWKPQPHAETFLRNIINVFGLSPENRVLEIGCNDGGFLQLLNANGYKNCLGIEPTQDASQIAKSKGLNVIRNFYGLSTIEEIKDLFPRPDLIISRQVIEHIPDLNGFLEAIRAHLAPDGGIALEFPDHSMNYEQLDYSFWEEHVNYFTLSTIRLLLARHGFEIVHHETTLFSGKCLFIYARLAEKYGDEVLNPSELALARRYIKTYPKFVNDLHSYLDIQSTKSKIIMYGCGSRSSNFINLTKSAEYFSCFVDDQPQKQGKYAPGSMLPITAPSERDPLTPVALGVNSENEFLLRNKRHLSKSFSVLPPSSLLPEFWRTLSRQILTEF